MTYPARSGETPFAEGATDVLALMYARPEMLEVGHQYVYA